MSIGAQQQPVQYVVPSCGYRVVVPLDWSIHAEYDDDTVSRVSFGLPPIWSDLEQQEIENAIAVIAHRRSDLSSVQDVVDLERLRHQHILISSTDVDLQFGRAQRMITEIRGLQYISLVVCRLENGVGYVFSFTATEGTYDRNRERFIEFLSMVEFFPPDPKAKKVYPSRFQEAMLLFRTEPNAYQRIIRLLQAELDDNPTDLETVTLLAMAYYESNRFEEALSFFDSAIVLNEGLNPHVYLYKGKALHKLGRSAEARQLLRATWALFQGNARLSADYDELMSQLQAEEAKEQDTD